MWKRCGRSAALDRAEALLSAQKNRVDAGSARGSAAQSQGSVDGTTPNRRISFADLSDLSSSSSAPEYGAPIAGSAAAGGTRGTDERKDPRPQNCFGAGSRFLKKKALPPASDSHHSPVNKDKLQQKPVHRNDSTSVQSSQTAALSRLTQIESRISSRKQTGQEPKSVQNLTSSFGISPPPAAQSPEDSVELSEQSNRDQSPKGKRFLKKISAAVNDRETSAVLSPQSPDFGARSRSRTAGVAGVSSTDLETKKLVSLDSDEEDMRKLLGDSFDSEDNSLIPEIRPFTRREEKMSSKGRQWDQSSPPPVTSVTSSASNKTSISSPSPPPLCRSPFRFTGQAGSHFIPSVPTPPPCPPGRLNSPPRAGSPQRSLSSMSGRSNVVSLEELFSAGPGSEDPHSELSEGSSEDFKIKLMSLDDLIPSDLGFREGTPGEEARFAAVVPAPLKAEHHQQEEEVDYESDFGSEGVTVVSEHLNAGGDEEEVGSEVTEGSSMSSGRTTYDYSNTFSESSDSSSSPTSDHSQTLSRRMHSQSSRSSVSHHHQSRRRVSPKTVSNDAAVQTEAGPVPDSWLSGMTACGPPVGLTYSDSTPVVAHTLGAEMVEALSTFNPAAFVLNELLKQQLAIIRRSIETNRYLHYSLVQSLGPPNYRYTMLEDTREYIHYHRPQTDDGALT